MGKTEQDKNPIAPSGTQHAVFHGAKFPNIAVKMLAQFYGQMEVTARQREKKHLSCLGAFFPNSGERQKRRKNVMKNALIS